MTKRQQVTKMRRDLNALASQAGVSGVTRQESEAIVTALEEAARRVLEQRGIETKARKTAPKTNPRSAPHPA
jgi:hypothetical protein